MSLDATGPAHHDRDTENPDRNAEIVLVSSVTEAGSVPAAPDALRAALARLRLDGAVFLRGECTEGWAFESPPPELLAALLHPGAERVILLHMVVNGSCWVATDDGERHWATRGDVIVLPYGDHHTMGGAEDAECVPIQELVDPPPWDELPVIRLGCGGPWTEIVCGYLASDDPLFDPTLRALPEAFVVRPSASARGWMEASIRYALEQLADGGPGDSLLATRLPELVLVEVLRLHLATAPAADHGWLAALRDPVLAPALSQLHEEPSRKWTVSDLAAGSAVSRSLLDERFRVVLGRSPIRYLTEWRMHLAEDLLATTDLGVAAIARRVGYESEEAFSRAFKRARGLPPAEWRAALGRPWAIV